MSSVGTANEDSYQLSKQESATVRRRSLRLLGSLLRPIWLRMTLTIAMVVLSQAARAAGPLIIAFGIDRALPALTSGEPGQIVFAGIGYIVAATLTGVLTAGYVTATAQVSQSMLLDLRRRVFIHTQRLSLDFHETYTSGRIISRQTSDLEALRELLDSGISSIVSGLMFMLFTAISIFTLDWLTGVLILLAAVPVYLLIRWYQKRSQVAFRASRVAAARLIVHFVETMTGIRAVKAFRREKANSARYSSLSNNYRKVTLRSLNLNGMLQPGLLLIGNVTVAVMLLVGGFRVLDGTMAVGALLAVLLATKRFFQPIGNIAGFYSSFQSAQAALEKVSGLLDEVPAVQPPKQPTSLPQARGELNFSHVDFGYGDAPLAIEDLNLHIPAGQTVAVVGQTGAGKSTLAKLVARFYDVTAGSLTLDGVPLDQLSMEDLRRAIVMVTQEAFLFSGTVAENIALGRPTATPNEIVAAAKAVGAHDFISALPEGYDTNVNKRGGRISAGQRQLLSFARAFIAEPPVLILDEATASLDIPSERAVQAGLHQLLSSGRAKTAIIIAHRLSTVEIADRVLVVHDGAVVEDGSPEDLVAAGGRFAELNQAWQDSLV